MKHHFQYFWSATIFLLGLLIQNNAFAQMTDSSFHFNEGVRLSNKGMIPEALEQFQLSYRLAPSSGAAYNIGSIHRYYAKRTDGSKHPEKQQRHYVYAFNWLETSVAQFDIEEDLRKTRTKARDDLLPKVGVVDIRTSPQGATLYVDRTDLGEAGKSPRKIALMPGNHKIFIKSDGYHQVVHKISVSAGQVVPLEFKLRRIVGTLSVTSSPPGAKVIEARTSEILGTTPIEVTLPEGEHRIRLIKQGYVEQAYDTIIRSDEQTHLDVELERRASEVAVLSVVSTPIGALVTLDDEELGITPLTVDGLDPGPQILEVLADGRTSWSREILLEGGGATRVNVELADPTDRMWAGWRWIGYGGGGATLIAGAICGILALVHKNAFFATDNPTRAQYDQVRNEGLSADVLLSVGGFSILMTFIMDMVFGRAPESVGRVTIGS